jgi:thioredoxin reductase
MSDVPVAGCAALSYALPSGRAVRARGTDFGNPGQPQPQRARSARRPITLPPCLCRAQLHYQRARTQLGRRCLAIWLHEIVADWVFTPARRPLRLSHQHDGTRTSHRHGEDRSSQTKRRGRGLQPVNIPDMPPVRCDVCVVGAGITGLNALFVASRYQSGARELVLVDRRDRVGGMWVDTYEYVRLHQPHRFFTAGNIEWTLGAKPEHLATRDEVLGHLQHCLDVIKRDAEVTELLGHEFERAEDGDGPVRVTCRSPDGRLVNIEADRLIKAYGQRVEPIAPLELSSAQIRSASPDHIDMQRSLIATGDAPVWVIGGGKTGMDTAHLLVTAHPAREVNLVAGSGTFFTSRDRAFPSGLRRWWDGEPFSLIIEKTARRFDGNNEAAVMEWYRTNYANRSPLGTGNFKGGILSEAENEVVASGLNRVVMDHLVDIVDSDRGTEMVLRSGATLPVEPGSWVVNCTGYLYRSGQPYESYTSSTGNVLSVQNRSSTIPLPFGGLSAYLLTHLMFLGKLVEVPLYELDLEDLQTKAPQHAVFATLCALQCYNLGLIADEVPARFLAKINTENGMDADTWYPFARRQMTAARRRRNLKSERERFKRALDTIARRFDVRCGPVVKTRPLQHVPTIGS